MERRIARGNRIGTRFARGILQDAAEAPPLHLSRPSLFLRILVEMVPLLRSNAISQPPLGAIGGLQGRQSRLTLPGNSSWPPWPWTGPEMATTAFSDAFFRLIRRNGWINEGGREGVWDGCLFNFRLHSGVLEASGRGPGTTITADNNLKQLISGEAESGD